MFASAHPRRLRVLLLSSLLLALLAITLNFSARREIPEQGINELIQKIRTEVPKGWDVSYEKETSCLNVYRIEDVPAISTSPNLPPEPQTPEQTQFYFSFRTVAFVPLDEHRRRSIKNVKFQKELNALYTTLERKGVSHKFDSFSPSTNEEKADVTRYEALKESLYDLPEFYFRDFSLLSAFKAQTFIVDDRIRDECKQVEERVTKLLSRYDETSAPH